MFTDCTSQLQNLNIKYPKFSLFVKGCGKTKTLQIPKELYTHNDALEVYINKWLFNLEGERDIFSADFVIFYPLDSVHYANDVSQGLYLLEENGEYGK